MRQANADARKRGRARVRRAFQPSAAWANASLERRMLLANLPAGFTETTVASGITFPTSMTVGPDDRVYVTEFDGNIRVVDQGQLAPEPYLALNANSKKSMFLMSVTFAPDFETSRHVYVYYINVENGVRNRLSRFEARGDSLALETERVIYQSEPLVVQEGDSNHNGGAVAFGPDGKIYISTGDMGNPRAAQQLNNTLGKILRINPDGSIPRDNPFYRRTRGLARAIYAYGLRNPFTMTFQPGTGRLYINDVGGVAWEEINVGKRGANYGWPLNEGATRRRGVTSPFYAYDHGQPATLLDTAIVGGAFYNPRVQSFPFEYAGRYFFTDHARGFIRTLSPETGNVTTFATGLPIGVVSLTMDSEGRIYYLTIGDGALRVIQYSPEVPPTLPTPLADVRVAKNKPAILEVSPAGTFPFAYQWQANGVDIEGATARTLEIPADQIDPDIAYRVIITNAYGAFTSNEAFASSTNDAEPTARILRPSKMERPSIGQLVSFAGAGFDEEAPGGVLPASAMVWRVDLLHNSHVHPNLFVVNGAEGSFRVPRHDAQGKFGIRLTLTVTDSSGQTASDSIELHPVVTATRRRRR